eukprot:GHVH01007009.1.p1 GENE.GHVH01007009.1~~GHVH01007009.1.p1  ORF type:complete len:610 (-),score=64.80 GHVH01007009.1:62-1891(-)
MNYIIANVSFAVGSLLDEEVHSVSEGVIKRGDDGKIVMEGFSFEPEIFTGFSSFGTQTLELKGGNTLEGTVNENSFILPLVRECWWENIEIPGFDQISADILTKPEYCRDWCSIIDECEMWTFDSSQLVCFAKIAQPDDRVTLREKARSDSGRETCRIEGDYDNFNIQIELAQNSEAVSGRVIGYLDMVDLTQCAVACDEFPRCVGFNLYRDGLCELRAGPLVVIPLPEGSERSPVSGKILGSENSTTTVSPSSSTSLETTSTTTTTSTTRTLGAIRPAQPGEYGVINDFRGQDFLDQSQFTWETFNDPTRGYVDYISLTEARQRGMVEVTGNNRTILRSDSTMVGSGRGRKSIRLSSRRTWEEGLIIWRIYHMPAGCGNWPALWTVGPNWPNNGEIDVVEGANQQITNNVALHTGPSCSMFGSTLPFEGDWIRYYKDNTEVRDCYARATPENYGCAIDSSTPNSFGPDLNAINGGWFVLEMNDEHIKVWFFNADNAPADIAIGAPSPDTWPVPQAAFAMGNECIFKNNFRQQVLVINNTFCGGYAGWSFSNDNCPDLGGRTQLEKCENFVRTQPSAFKEAFWDIDYIRVYQVSRGLVGVPEDQSSRDL